MKKPMFRYQKFVVPVWFCIAGAVNAQESSCDPGVYVGKIGNVPITMALDPTPEKSLEERRVGSMYYRVSMVDMLLKQESMQPIWTEFDGDNKPSGRITLTCHDKQLLGEWHSLDGKKRFPVVASRSPEDEYNARRFSALKPIKTPKEPQSRSEAFPVTGPKIQGSDEPVIRGIQLFGTEPGVAKVNRLLWADLLANTESILSCSLEFRQRFGENPPALGFEQRFSHAAGPYVVVSSHSGFECGYGMRYGVEMATYRLTDGQKVDSSQWFKPELHALWKKEWRTTPLAKLVLRVGSTQMHKDDVACFEAAEYRLSDVYPSREGFVFRGIVPTPFQFCQGAVDVSLPYDRLAPFLSAEGKRAVQAIQKMPNR
ncbi:hypothetical protein HZ993_00710 [Rhodoferax sp. AJA081-3]|uniref:hypothetical protein n=1 Tax=Rhodoferax sp. AJA081-3 TaxID=2752316 RepID=UPI001ADF283B|nr:hypothetical protein [Rhodoferax sp. AJA081-3]QTN28414.1 hypothetical protein HZ993_00710 [Rhodoferax sp. AJA081-3]